MPRRGEGIAGVDREALARSRFDFACRLVARGYDLAEIAERRRTPDLDTLLDWLSDNPEFRRRYKKAHDARMERLARSIVALADDKRSNPRDRKLGLEARKWLMSHMEKKAQKEAPALEAEEAKQSHREEIARRLREAGERMKRYDEQLRQEAAREAVEPRERLWR